METTGQDKLLPSLGEGFRAKISKSTFLELLSITIPQPQKDKIEFKQVENIWMRGEKSLTFQTNNHFYTLTSGWKESLRKPAKCLLYFC